MFSLTAPQGGPPEVFRALEIWLGSQSRGKLLVVPKVGHVQPLSKGRWIAKPLKADETRPPLN